MNKFFTPFVFLLILLSFGGNEPSAQTNGGFEEWEPSGSPPPFDWEFPSGWTTNNATTEFTGAGVNPTDDAHSGNLAAHLRTVNVFGTRRSAQLVLGDADLDFPNYSVIAHTGGEPLAMRPRAVRFYYKLTIDGTISYAAIDVLIKRPVGNAIDTIFYETAGLNVAAEYTEVEIPISLIDFNPSTDSIVISFASNAGSLSNLNELFVDDVSIDFTSANNQIPEPYKVSLFPNPVHSGQPLTISHHDDVEISEIKIVDATGKYYSQNDAYSTNKNITTISTCGLAPGIYWILSNEVNPVRFLILD